MDIRIYNHLLLLLGAFCITLVLTACGNSDSGGNSNSVNGRDNSVALRVAVPDSLRNSFCAKFEVSAVDMPGIIVEQDYTANSLFVDAVLSGIKAGKDRELALGLFEGRSCGELNDADWLGKDQGIVVNTGAVTRVNLGLNNMTTGTIIVSGQLQNLELHGEVVAADDRP